MLSDAHSREHPLGDPFLAEHFISKESLAVRLRLHWRTHMVAVFDIAPPIEMTTGTS